MYEFLMWLDGRKTAIFACLFVINTYLMATNTISQDLGAAIASILGILSGGAVVATNKVLGANINRSK
jgi:asparagine N-glycosylation enzyme membrane subunit Stt3